jgi:hypothetical protein
VARSYEDDDDQKKTFHCDLIADSKDAWKEPYNGKKTQTVSLMKAIHNCKVDQWGPDQKKWPKFEHPCIKDGNKRVIDGTNPPEILDGYEGKWYIHPKSGEKYPPKIDGKDLDLYGGCYVRAEILCRPYSTGKNKGVSLRLLSIMKVREGEKFGLSGGGRFDEDEIEENDELEASSDDDENWDE